GEEGDKKGDSQKERGVIFITPVKDRMWVGRQPVTLRLRNIDPGDVRMVEVYLDGRLIKDLETPPYAFSHQFDMKGHNRTLKVLVRGQDMKVLARGEIRSFQADDSQAVVVNQVMVPVVVKDKKGNYVRGLKKEDFVVLSDGKRMDVSYLEVGGTTKFNMAQVIDISFSMREKIHDVLRAAGEFMRQLLTVNDRGVFIFFNHIIFDHTGLTGDMNELMASLELEAPVIGGTALYDALAHTIDLMRKTPGWNIIVLFSDGMDTNSYIDRQSLLEKVKGSAVVIYGIDNQGSEGNVLSEICELSGGWTFPLLNVRKTRKVYERIREDINARYILFFSPKHRRGRRFHSLSVKVKNKKYEIRTLKGYH
ncbi:MAG: VWA domain-containing protein, partial [bacterium]|nr:VWA domain-containing protein [bacterium]